MLRLLMVLLLFAGILTWWKRPVTSRHTPPPNPEILAFGDSLTYGFGSQDPATQSYPARLQRITGQPVVNAGVNGETSAEGLRRIESLLRQYRPGLVILCLGGNDILQRHSRQELKKNLRRIILQIRASGAKIFLIAVPDFGILGLNPLPLYQELAQEYDLPVEEDLLPEILSQPALKSDPVHPNALGYRRMAEQIYQRLKEEGLLSQSRSNP